MGRTLRILFFLLTCLFLAACTHNPAAADMAPPSPLPSKPKHLLVLVFPSLSPGRLASSLSSLPHFSALEASSLSFSQAWVGDLAATPFVSLPVLTSGLMPKHLPWQDEVFHPKTNFSGVARLGPRLSQLLEQTRSTSLGTRLKGIVLTIAPTPALARALGGPGAQVYKGAADPVAAQVVQALETPHWRAILARFDDDSGELPGPESDRLERLDRALGTVLAAVKERGLDSSTLLVVTSDRGRGPEGVSLPHRISIANLLAQPDIAYSLQDSWWRFWLKTNDRVVVAKFSDFVRGFPEVAELYTKQVTGTSVHYIRNYRNPRLRGDALAWADERDSALMDSMADAAAPQVVALLMPEAGNVGTGAQEDIQRIPLLLRAPNLKVGESTASVRLVDLNPMISRVMGLAQPEAVDGVSDALNDWVLY